MAPNPRFNGVPGEPGLPLIGKSLELLRNPAAVSDHMVKHYGMVYWTNAFGRASVSMLGRDANEFVLMDRDKNFSSKGGWNPILERLFPNGLMLRDFDDHRAHRRIMQVAFKQPAMQNYVEKL